MAVCLVFSVSKNTVQILMFDFYIKYDDKVNKIAGLTLLEKIKKV